MVIYFTRLRITLFLLAFVQFGLAQKSIVISDSLAAHADRFPVKTGNAWPWKVYNFSFGDYSVASSKAGWTTGSSAANLPGTKSKSKSSSKFSFVLTNKTTDSVQVNAAYQYTLRELHQQAIFPVFVGREELLEETNNFTAVITMNGDTSAAWVLFIAEVKGSAVDNKYEAILTNKDRVIFLHAASADKSLNLLSAAGYEFVENGQSLAAVQYFGGGMLGVNKKVIWMDRVLEGRMKFVLAAAMTAVMQFRS